MIFRSYHDKMQMKFLKGVENCNLKLEFIGDCYQSEFNSK